MPVFIFINLYSESSSEEPTDEEEISWFANTANVNRKTVDVMLSEKQKNASGDLKSHSSVTPDRCSASWSYHITGSLI